MSDKPDSYDKIKRRRRRPLKALRHFRELIRNKEDTTQVFYIIEALNGNSFQKRFRKFAKSEKGQKRIAEDRFLPDILDNHEWLQSLPNGSLGRAYLDFMKSEGLTAHGLVEEYIGYTHAQHGGLGVIFIAYGAAWEIRKSAPKGAQGFAL